MGCRQEPSCRARFALLDRGTFYIFVKQPRLGPGERGASLENASYDLPARRALIVSANISSRLAAVWFADIVGYSRLASRDETSALALVEQLRSMIEEILAEHGGRLVKATGDGGLAEFASAEAAVRSGLALERRFAERAGLLVPGARLRVGIHVGEVVPGAGGDLYGDGVNTAARLQQSAEPGQVVVSEDVWRSLRQRSELWFTPLGERRLKGLAAPIRVFQVAPGERAARRGDRYCSGPRRGAPAEEPL